MLLYLALTARGTLQERVTGSLRECLFATISLVYGLSRRIQQRAR